MQLSSATRLRVRDIFNHIICSEGWRGLWKGGLIDTVRCGFAGLVYFATMTACRAHIPGAGHLAQGAIAAGTATLCLNPFEVVLTRLYLKRQAAQSFGDMARGLSLCLARNVPRGRHALVADPDPGRVDAGVAAASQVGVVPRMRVSLSPPYPRPTPAQACLTTQGCVRLIQRRHCFYKVCQKTDKAAVWCRPVSQEAIAWMRGRGVDAERHLCDLDRVGLLVSSVEGQIEAQAGRRANNIVPAPKSKTIN